MIISKNSPITEMLIAGCRNAAATANILPEYIFAHAVLFGTAILGGKACYKQKDRQAPQLIRSPATILTDDRSCPPWFNQAVEGAVKIQSMINRRAEGVVLAQPSSRQIKDARRLASMYRPIEDILPSQLKRLAMTSTPPLHTSMFRFLHDVAKEGGIRKESPALAYGPDLLALAVGSDSFRTIFRSSDHPRSLIAGKMASAAKVNVTVHGWSERLPTLKLLRTVASHRVTALGWLLRFPTSSIVSEGFYNSSANYSQFFDILCSLRAGKPYTFLPSHHIAESLDQADRKQSGHPVPGDMAHLFNPQTSLAWNLATVLWAVERSLENPHPEENPRLADLACHAAQLIRTGHTCTIQTIVPASVDPIFDIFDASIIDKLSVGPLHFRELRRRFHRIKAVELAARLQNLASRGLIFAIEGGMWHSLAVYPRQETNFLSAL